MKSSNFTVGMSFSIKARNFKLLLRETKYEGWIKIILADEDKKVFLEESCYTGVNLRKDKTINKLHKKVDNLEINYKTSKANMIKLLEQCKQLIKSL